MHAFFEIDENNLDTIPAHLLQKRNSLKLVQPRGCQRYSYTELVIPRLP